jgi:hypothetical protein
MVSCDENEGKRQKLSNDVATSAFAARWRPPAVQNKDGTWPVMKENVWGDPIVPSTRFSTMMGWWTKRMVSGAG